MALRPIAFSIPSTTELKVTFTDPLSLTLSAQNFQVDSLNGAVDDLEVLGISIDQDTVIIKTRPQVAGNYYLLKFLDTIEVPFTSVKGTTIPYDSNSRELFFVGIDNVNPIRDRMFESIPGLFEIENTTLKTIISAQAQELYTAQKKIGEVLSNNYLSVENVDEARTRSAGATDRLANENAYEITRVARNQTGSSPTYEILDYTIGNDFERLKELPVYPVSLQQVIVANEEISLNSEGNSFQGFLLQLKNRNVIKLLSVKFIASDDVEDCDGNLGTVYDIERYGYSIKSNFYDQDFAFSFSKLTDNQILLSEFGNLPTPTILDTFIVSYLYKDVGRFILEDQVEVSRVESILHESVPTNSTNFFLNHAPIVSSNNKLISLGGVEFLISENDTDIPAAFQHELVFNSNRLPSQLGEYSINYQTGEVFLVGGEEIGEGTARNNFVVNYNYRKEFSVNVDYSIYEQNLVAIPDRELANQEAEITIRYDKTFAEGIDYRNKSHIEVMPEFVENRLSQSFRITTKNVPITNVFRILNQTTGEVYQPLFNTDNEIAFSGNRSPEIKNVTAEEAVFQRSDNEALEVIGEFIIPAFRARITSTSSNNSIMFSPGIPAELISANSVDYFFREVSNSNQEITTEDVNIKFFDTPNSNNLITSAAISLSATPPTLNSQVIIGTRGYFISLNHEGLLNQNLDSLGSHVNTSVEFSDLSLFKQERYFEPIQVNPGLESTSSGGISKAITADKDSIFYQNLARLRKVGDYTIDYQHGLVYLAVSLNQDINVGNINYNFSAIQTRNHNLLAISSVAKKKNSPDPLSEAEIIYEFVNDQSSITPINLENTLEVYDGETKSTDVNGDRQLICTILEDYTAVVSHDINSINGIYQISDLTGSDLQSSNPDLRREDFSPFELNMSSRLGGRNLFEPQSVTFNNNVIDFKKNQKRRAIFDGNNLVVTISDPNASLFVEAKLVATDQVLFDQDLNLDKLSGLEIVHFNSGIVDIASGVDLTSVDADQDFLLDQNGNRFRITAVNTLLSKIGIETPAENNSSVTAPVLGTASIIIKPTVTVNSSGIILTIPGDTTISNGSLIEVVYLTNLIPQVGTSLAIDYRFGFIFTDYSYVYDELVVWYEYGDNALDWSISDALQEGEQYFVTYKYGALRDALRVNFGTLTNIPFFKSFGINTDRELYRDALIGTLQSFPKGPTIPSFKELVKSFTKIDPNINELVFGNWILGRDYLNPGVFEYKGVLEFAEAKFKDGLMFNDDVVVNIPAISSINLDEGTLEAWVRPSWAGINNDATLTFDLNNFGTEIISLFQDSKPFDFDQNWSLFPTSNLVGKINTGNGINIFNYKSDSEEDHGLNVGSYGLYKNQTNLNHTIASDALAVLKVNFIGSHFNDLRKIITDPASGFEYCQNEQPGEGFFIVGSYGPGTIVEGPWPINLASPAPTYGTGSFFIADGDRSTGFSFNLTQVPNFLFEVSPRLGDGGVSSVDGDTVPAFDQKQFVKPCFCNTELDLTNLLNFQDLQITVELSEDFDLTAFKSNNILDDSPQVFILVDSDGIFYQVIGFYDQFNLLQTNYIPDSFTKIVLKKFGINNPSLSAQGSDLINQIQPVGVVKLFYKSADILTKQDYSNSVQVFDFSKVNVLDWSQEHQYVVSRDPSNNLVNYKIDDQSLTMFYTDAFYSCNLNFGLTVSSEDLKGVMIGVTSPKLLVDLELLKLHGNLENRYTLADIYIGKDGHHPKQMPFSINRFDYPSLSVGEPSAATSEDGFFIWFDEVCKSPLSDNIGQWICRARSSRVDQYPSDVIINGDLYSNIFNSEVVNYEFSGTITTSGEFSSVARAFREEDVNGCTSGIICNNSFRYCGKELLEEFGWTKLEDTDSTLINTILRGRDTVREEWRKVGEFDTSVSSGIYRMGPSTASLNCVDENKALGNLLYTEMPCPDGNYEQTVSIRVAQVGNLLTSSTGRFSGTISGVLTGIVPIHLLDADLNIKLALAFTSTGQSLLVVIDGVLNQIIDFIPYFWNDQNFHEYRVEKDKLLGKVSIYVDNIIVSQISMASFSTPISDSGADFTESTIGIYLVDGNLVDLDLFHQDNIPNVIDVDLIFFAGNQTEGDGYLEADDFLLNTDSKIEFKFEIDNEDGYVTSDGYDGYLNNLVGVDEIFITSDQLRYLIDTGVGTGDQRFSIFKDGKGFLNFQIADDSLRRSESSQIFNLATNIKNFKPGELHHIAASWKLNTITERDEMHLFVDGQEAPNIFKFGGKIPVRVNDKFRDVSKEVLYDFLVNEISFCDQFTDGTIQAGNAIFQSAQVNFTQDMVGRSILITNSELAPSLVGGQYIIKSVIDSQQITLGRGNSVDLITFQISTNDLQFQFPPTAGLVSDVLTDLRNSRLAIFRTKSDTAVEEMAGIYYEINQGEVEIIKGENALKPKFRVNLDSRLIEFVGQDINCNYVATIDPTDLDVHIETYGLNLENSKQKIILSGSSYATGDAPFSGQSVIRTIEAEPASLSDVQLTRIILDRTVIDIVNPIAESNLGYLVDFEIDLNDENGFNKISSESGQVSKQNLGRLLTLMVDSDNLNLCQVDGYADGFNIITVFGTTTDGIDQETFEIIKNGDMNGSKYFTSVNRVSGTLLITDPDYFEAALISIRETNSVSVSDNGGSSAEFFDYQNGNFIVTTTGSSGTFPFELHPGVYDLEYPAYLTLNLPRVGEKLYIGSDFNEQNQFGGLIDEFRIISELSSDTRITEQSTSGTRSVTSDYNKSIPFCADSQTLTLIHFDNPIELQSRRLRNTEFLDTSKNIKYTLSSAKQELLLSLVNDPDLFMSKMLNWGFSLDDANRVFYEVHRAGGGPLFNDADFYRNFVEFPKSDNSVNTNFGKSGNFTNGKGLLILNDSGQFRQDQGTIEFWVSPIIDTKIDNELRYYVDISSIKQERIKSTSSTLLELPNAAKEIVSVKLLQQTQQFVDFYTTSEKSTILFDEISRSEISGRLEGGTGTQKDFGLGSQLSADGNKITLVEALPGQNVDVIVSYIPLASQGDRVSIFKDTHSQIVFAITAGGIDNVVSVDVDWKKNSWHRIKCIYRTGTSSDTMRIFVDGVEGGIIRYGTGIIYGEGYIYGQYIQGEGQFRTNDYNIPLNDEFKLIAIGSDIFGSNNVRSRLDNIRFSRIIRDIVRDSQGLAVDLNYSSNLNTISPVVEDDVTTLLLDFDENGDKVDTFATIIDPEHGIYDFDIEVIDDFDRVIGINNGEIEDLIINLVNRLKPAHTNALVKFTKNRC